MLAAIIPAIACQKKEWVTGFPISRNRTFTDLRFLNPQSTNILPLIPPVSPALINPPGNGIDHGPQQRFEQPPKRRMAPGPHVGVQPGYPFAGPGHQMQRRGGSLLGGSWGLASGWSVIVAKVGFPPWRLGRVGVSFGAGRQA